MRIAYCSQETIELFKKANPSVIILLPTAKKSSNLVYFIYCNCERSALTIKLVLLFLTNGTRKTHC